MKFAFSKPFAFEGETYESLDIPLESMSGKDFCEAQKGWKKAGGVAVIPAMDSEFCAHIAAKMAKKPLEFFEALPVRDFCQLTQAVSNFLLASD